VWDVHFNGHFEKKYIGFMSKRNTYIGVTSYSFGYLQNSLRQNHEPNMKISARKLDKLLILN